ncbi:hypothetical protein GCM10009087_07380 [Sphingomonas oligophenolica]
MSTQNLKLLAGLLGLAVVALAAFCVLQTRSLGEVRQENASLVAQLAESKDKALITAKRECAERAASVFHSMGYSDKGDGGKLGLDTQTYTNHYSPRLKRCLMELMINGYQSGGTETVQRFVIDADERADFGDYSWVSSQTKKYWEQKPVICKMIPPGKDEMYCKSTDEWDAYVKSLMS